MSEESFAKLLPHGLGPNLIVPYAHKGEWAVHELLPVLFSEIGPFHLSLSTFNISEESLRPVFFMKERGEILSARFLFDNNVKRHKIDMMLFAGGIADDVRTSSTHMKLLIAENDQLQIAVVGSANMNRNIRHEAGFIVTDKICFTYFREYFETVFTNDSLPFYL